MNDDLTRGGVIVTGILLVLGALAAFLVKVVPLLKNGKKDQGDDSAGARSTAWWQMEFKDMEDRIAERNERFIEMRLVPIMNDIKAALQVLIRWKGGD
jgi:hypothetical protein